MKCAPVQDDLFKVMFRDLVAKGHELVLLRDAIDWSRFERALAPAYSGGGWFCRLHRTARPFGCG